MTDEARLVIFEQYWPGNIREVKRFLEKCNTLALGVIDANTVKSFVQAQPLVSLRERKASEEGEKDRKVQRVREQGKCAGEREVKKHRKKQQNILLNCLDDS